MLNELLWVLLWGTIGAGVYGLLHFAGPEATSLPEFYRRPLYYGVGFAVYLSTFWGYGLCSGDVHSAVIGTLLGGLHGMGMLTSYAVHNLREREGVAAITAVLDAPERERDHAAH